VRTLIGDAVRLFEEDAAAWRMRVGTAVAIAVAPVALSVGVAAAHFYHPLYRFLTAEDSVLEWSQFFSIAAAAVVFGAIAWRLARRRDWRWAVLFAAGALAAVMIAGEEISWGQRVFGLATPDILEGVNTQGESNLHNVSGVLKALNFGWMVGAGLFTLLPLIALLPQAAERVRAWRTSYRIIPPLALVPAFAIPFAYRFARFVRSGGTSGSFAEVVELSLYAGILVFALLVLRRIDSETTAAPA
jgi:hypothetical protein